MGLVVVSRLGLVWKLLGPVVYVVVGRCCAGRRPKLLTKVYHHSERAPLPQRAAGRMRAEPVKAASAHRLGQVEGYRFEPRALDVVVVLLCVAVCLGCGGGAAAAALLFV